MADDTLPPEIDAKVEDQRDKDLLRIVALGEDFERFIKSHLGRHLIACAERDRQAALERLANTSLLSPAGIVQAQECQLEVMVVDRWQQWCAEAIQAGTVAEAEFIGRNSQ